MKGFIKDDKFHPIRDTKGVRKSRDQSAKTIGVKIERKARTVSSSKLPDVSLSRNYWGFETNEDGEITKLRLGNWVDAGWHWDGDEDDIVGYLVRINKSQVRDEFIETMEKNDLDYMKLKPLLLKKVENGTWLYEISGDNVRWHFKDDIDEGAMSDDQLKFSIEQEEETEFTDDEKNLIGRELWDFDTNYEFEDFERDYGDRIKKEMKEMIRDSNTYEEFFEKMDDEKFTYQINEDYILSAEDKIRDGLFKAIEKLRKEGRIRKTEQMRIDK